MHRFLIAYHEIVYYCYLWSKYVKFVERSCCYFFVVGYSLQISCNKLALEMGKKIHK